MVVPEPRMHFTFLFMLFQGPGKAGVPVSGVHMRRPQALPRVRHHQVQRSQGHRAGRRREYKCLFNLHSTLLNI